MKNELNEEKSGRVTLSLEKRFKLLKDSVRTDQINNTDITPQADIISIMISSLTSQNIYDKLFFQNILNFLGENNLFSTCLFTAQNPEENVILATLRAGIYVNVLDSIIYNLTEDSKTAQKAVLTPPVINELKYIIKNPVSTLHPRTIIQKLIEPLYEEDSVEHLIELIGSDWIDNYYD